MPLTFFGTDVDRYWRAGELQPISIRCVDPLTGDLLDLTSAQAHYKLATPNPVTKNSTVPGQISIDVPTSTITVNLSGTDAPAPEPGIYDHELTVLFSDGSTRTIFAGLVQFVPQLTASFFGP